MAVDLSKYIFQLIEYDPTENPRGVVTADEWNTILNLLKSASNYTSRSLQEIVADLYTKSALASKVVGADGARLIGVDTIPGVIGSNVNDVLRDLKSQLDAVSLGAIPDRSLTSEKLSTNLNFIGETLTFNDVQIVTTDYIVDRLSGGEIDKAPSVNSVNTALNTKQSVISIGEAEPNANTPGNIYLQYIA